MLRRSNTLGRMQRSRSLSLAFSLFGSVFAGCGQRPAAPTETEAREAFAERVPRLTNLENAINDGIRDAGLTKEKPHCATDETACFELIRKRDKETAEAQKEITRLLASWEIACAEITVGTPSHGEELVSRDATCPPGRRGDAVERGAKLGEYDVGWGVYFENDQVMKRGISVHRQWKDGDATATIEIYFFLDS